MRRVIWSDDAADELDGIEAYIAERNPLAAMRMGARLVAAAERLAADPWIGRPAPDGMREITTVAPYIIRYRVEADHVRVVRVRHGARKPDE